MRFGSIKHCKRNHACFTERDADAGAISMPIA
jgi:hypothetical protein